MRTNKYTMGTAGWSYLVMLVFTFLTFLAGESHREGLLLSLAVLSVALLKGHLLGDHFMGLAKVRGPWRWVVLVWLLLPAILIGTAFVRAAP